MTYFRSIFVAAAMLLMGVTHAIAACGAANNAQLGAAIGHGHAFAKHSDEFRQGDVIDGLAFPDTTIANADEFATFLTAILNAPTANKTLSNGRAGFWDTRTGTVIITNTNVDDCGTAFRPNTGMTYYNNLN